MITAAEYRARAEESLEWARIASKESSRLAYIKWAEIWLELASRAERLTALIEDRSKEPTPTAEYVWQLPPFQFHACEWAQLAALGHSADLMFGNSVASRGRIRHPNNMNHQIEVGGCRGPCNFRKRPGI